MKTRILIIPFLAISLALAGCGDSILKGGWSPTASVSNPVTTSMLYDVENSLIVAVSAAQTYKNLCIRKAIDRSCRAVVVKMQSYTRPAKQLLVKLRGFVRTNDQVNAIIAYNALRDFVSTLQQISAANKVQ